MDSRLLEAHDLPVSGGHVVHVDIFGSPDGRPAVVLHGGPGSGQSPMLRSGFDPRDWRVVCIDQRGCGASTPRGGVVANTTDDLIADTELVRTRLGIADWLVVGGSWGASLAIAYAAAHPSAVQGLLLRSTFGASRADVAAFFDGGPFDHGPPRSLALATPRGGASAASERPGATDGPPRSLALAAPRGGASAASERPGATDGPPRSLALAAPRGGASAASTAKGATDGSIDDVLLELRDSMLGDDEARRRETALAWWRWERSRQGMQAPPQPPTADAMAYAVDRYRVQSHYLFHDCWLQRPSLAQRCAALPRVPVLMVHGDADRVCPIERARQLAACIPQARWHELEGVGHDPTAPAMQAAMREGLAAFARDGSFDGAFPA